MIEQTNSEIYLGPEPAVLAGDRELCSTALQHPGTSAARPSCGRAENLI